MKVLNLTPENPKNLRRGILIWGSQIASLRNDESITHVTWGPKDLNQPRLATVDRGAFLSSIDNREGEFNPYGSSYYISLPLPKTPVNSKDQVVATTTVRLQSTTNGVEYEVFKIGDQFKVRRFGKTKTSVLKKTFDTETQAANYLRTACSAV